MNYEDRLQHVSVLGAAGKMGSGILLLAAIEMTDLRLKNKDKEFVLNAIDVSNKALTDLVGYIKDQAIKIGEKKLLWLRELWADRPDLIQNSDMVQLYVYEVLTTLRTTTRMETAYDSTLIFEAVSENRALKVKLFTQIDSHNEKQPWFFTNTSSIPISEIEKDAHLNGRVIGFHFYNPPAIQKLVELIVTPNTLPETNEFALQLAKNMKKVVVPSNDFAGFIGNGHFMRDALYAINKAELLWQEITLEESIYIVNKVSQDYLVRPMGIFQLIDYVGIDVVQFILKVMKPYNQKENLYSELLDKLVVQGVKGGQFANGSQKDGFLQYDKGKITGIYSVDEKKYLNIDNIAKTADAKLGKLPDSFDTWKNINFSTEKESILSKYFAELNESNTLGSEIAKEYVLKSKEIGEKLVADGVANSPDDVNKVMLTGFYHAYGPINNYVS